MTSAPSLQPEPGGGSLAVTGAAGTGKTLALVRRARQALAEDPLRRILVTAPSDAGVGRLHALLAGEPRATCTSFGNLAFELLCEARGRDGVPASLALIDDVRASQHFERAGAALFALEWTEFVSQEIDPEITGLRAPERFSAAAFRLIRKLRSALISPEQFLANGLRGATSFYGRPPNFAGADLLAQTPQKYHDSLRVTPAELQRQRAREVDLVSILARLYGSYVETLVSRGCLTPVDAVYETAILFRTHPELRANARRRFASAFVDDAQDLTGAELALLEAMFGASLNGVTLAGDEAQSTRAFAGGGRGVIALERAGTTVVLERPYRGDPALERFARRALESQAVEAGAAAAPQPPGVTVRRAENVRDEARGVALEVVRLMASGVPAERIAVVTRNLGCAHAYVDTLLAHGVPVDVAGAASLYAFPAVTDGLAALWSAADPFRHEYLLRTFEAPWLRLCDATIGVLCGDSSQGAQPLLFELPEEQADEARASRWDRRRDLRLARNLTRGDVDADLPDEARARIGAFREARARWEGAARSLGLGELARLVLGESVLATLGDDARGRFERGLLARLLDDVDTFERSDPLASLEDFLLHAQTVADAEADLLTLSLRDASAVRVLDVEAAKGEEFEAVFVVDLRAGSWPRYYVPDAFLFMPTSGMIPKENVGEARAARTAKFTYALYKYKLRQKYNAEERRALYCAATRARRRLYLSASGRATRGLSTPELLEELASHLTQS